MSTRPKPNTDSAAVRDHLVRALDLDLIGPSANSELAAEQLPGWIRPSNWYLTGFLIPSGTPAEARADVDEDEDLDAVPEVHGLGEESSDERKAAKKGFFPSSMGLSFLVEESTNTLSVTIRWGDQVRLPAVDCGDRSTSWRCALLQCRTSQQGRAARSSAAAARSCDPR